MACPVSLRSRWEVVGRSTLQQYRNLPPLQVAWTKEIVVLESLNINAELKDTQ